MSKFRLEKVLAHRRALETTAQLKLAAALQYESELRAEAGLVREKLAATDEEFEERKRTGVTADELLLYQGQRDRLARRLADLLQRCAAAAREVEERRGELVAASQDKRLLERLKEKKEEESRTEMRREENILLDEIAIQKFQVR